VTLLNVVDVEATCWEGEPPAGQHSEIIEIGIVVLNLETLERTGKRSVMVRPEHSEVSAFCTRLTGITPEEAASGVSFGAVLRITRASEQHRHPLHSLLRSFASSFCSLFCPRSLRAVPVRSPKSCAIFLSNALGKRATCCGPSTTLIPGPGRVGATMTAGKFSGRRSAAFAFPSVRATPMPNALTPRRIPSGKRGWRRPSPTPGCHSKERTTAAPTTPGTSRLWSPSW